jgi:hypothetical protein
MKTGQGNSIGGIRLLGTTVPESDMHRPKTKVRFAVYEGPKN